MNNRIFFILDYFPPKDHVPFFYISPTKKIPTSLERSLEGEIWKTFVFLTNRYVVIYPADSYMIINVLYMYAINLRVIYAQSYLPVFSLINKRWVWRRHATTQNITRQPSSLESLLHPHPPKKICFNKLKTKTWKRDHDDDINAKSKC